MQVGESLLPCYPTLPLSPASRWRGACITLPAACVQVGECLPWSAGDCSLSYTLHNHNSVLGLRELALRGGAEVHVVDFEDDKDAPTAAAAAAGPSAATSATADVAAVAPVAAAPATSRCPPGRMVHCHSMRRCMGPTLPVDAAEHKSGGRGSAEAGALAAGDNGSSGSDGGSGGRAGTGAQDTGNSSSRSAGSRSDGGSDGHQRGPSFHLLALPLECNFSGRRYDLAAAMEAAAGAGPHGNPSSDFGSGSGVGSGSGCRKIRSLVLVDAAKACATSPPDLSVHPVDFVALSYYKIFG